MSPDTCSFEDCDHLPLFQFSHRTVRPSWPGYFSVVFKSRPPTLERKRFCLLLFSCWAKDNSILTCVVLVVMYGLDLQKPPHAIQIEPIGHAKIVPKMIFRKKIFVPSTQKQIYNEIYIYIICVMFFEYQELSRYICCIYLDVWQQLFSHLVSTPTCRSRSFNHGAVPARTTLDTGGLKRGQKKRFSRPTFFQKNMTTLGIVKYDCFLYQIRLKSFRWKLVGFQDTGLRVAEPYPPRKTTMRLAPCFFRHLLMALNLHRRELSGFSRM